MRILITGANGFIGAHLLSHLSAAGHTLATFSRTVVQDGQAKGFFGDITSQKVVNDVVSTFKPQIVFHLSAFKSRSRDMNCFSDAIDVNLKGTLNLISALSQQDEFERLVVLGTGEEYGLCTPPFLESAREAPVSAYSFSKLCQTHLCETLYRLNNFPFVLLRPSIAYGPGQTTDMFLPALINTLRLGKAFPMTKGEQKRDFLYISDLIWALDAAMHSVKCEGKIINIASGCSVTVAHVAQMVANLLGAESLLEIGGLPYREAEIMRYDLDISLAKNYLGWEPSVSLSKGLTLTIESMT